MQELGQHELVGRTLASDKFPNNMDSYWFSVDPDAIVNPFDFVTVKHLFGTKTIGMINELSVVNESGVLAKVAMMANTGVESKSGKNVPVGMPVGLGKPVRFSTEKEVMFAIGIPEMAHPVRAGVIEMTNGLRVPVSLDVSYLLGPDTAHVNAAGISGNQKTSYLFFLLQSVYQHSEKYGLEIAIVIFNTKEQDLLHIDEKKKINTKTKKLFDLLDIEIEPFENVTYFLPRGNDGMPNSAFVPENFKTYSYGFEDAYDRLDLLLFGTDDRDLSPILNYIYESWPLMAGSTQVKTWTELLAFKDYPREVVANKSSLLHFLRLVQKFRRSPLFIDKKKTSIYLGKEITKIRPRDIFVVDIAMIPTLEEQGFVVGDVIKNVDHLYGARRNGNRPQHVLIFIDEVNRFVPRQADGKSAVAEQVMRTVISGRSRGTILFSAQQFKSAVDPALHENTGMHIMAKLGQSELSAPVYSIIDQSTKMNIVRLNRGELVMVHPAFRQPIKITFPKTPFRG